MISAISAYLFGEEIDECQDAHSVSESEDTVDDWVFVHHSRDEVNGLKSCERSEGGKKKKLAMDGSWFVTPPSGFIGVGDKEADAPSVCTLENLLIEHPSMSVYGPRQLKNHNIAQTNGSSPKETAVRPVVNPKVSVNGENRHVRQSKIFLNQPANKRVPMRELRGNHRHSVSFTSSRKGSRKSNQVHARVLKGTHHKQHNRKDSKHVGMVAKRAT